MSVVREPLAVFLGLLVFACAAGACWQAGLAWPAASGRPLARIAAGLATVLAAFGFSLGYWEVFSGIGHLIYRFDTPITRFLFDFAAIGLPFAAVGLLLGVASTVHASDVPARAIVPAILAGYAIGWLVDPYALLAGPRMDPVRARYAASLAASNQGGAFGSLRPWHLFDNWSGGGSHSGGGGGGDGGGSDGEGAVILLLLVFAVLAIASGVITAALVFGAARKKAKAQLDTAHRFRFA